MRAAGLEPCRDPYARRLQRAGKLLGLRAVRFVVGEEDRFLRRLDPREPGPRARRVAGAATHVEQTCGRSEPHDRVGDVRVGGIELLFAARRRLTRDHALVERVERHVRDLRLEGEGVRGPERSAGCIRAAPARTGARKSTSSSFCDVCSMRDGIGTICSARPPRASISRGCDSDLAIHFVPSRFVTLAALNSSTTSARSWVQTPPCSVTPVRLSTSSRSAAPVTPAEGSPAVSRRKKSM